MKNEFLSCAIKVYSRAVAMLAPERVLASVIVLINVALGTLHIAEPVLLGWIVDGLAKRREGIWPLILTWAALVLFGIVAGTVTSIFADRLAHRSRLDALGKAFDHAVTLPASYHAERGSGAVIRAILSGTMALFWFWNLFLREQLAAIVGLLSLIPTVVTLDYRMAALLTIIAILYVSANTFVIGRTAAGQSVVEQREMAVYGRVGDVLGNVSVVQIYTRIGAEIQAMQKMTAELLTAQYPVLTWWGLLAALTRILSTMTTVSILLTGAIFVHRGEMTVGTVVSFAAFATLLTGQLDRLTGMAIQIGQDAPTLRTYFALRDAEPEVRSTKSTVELNSVTGEVAYTQVNFSYGLGRAGVTDLTFHAAAGRTLALVGPSGSGKTTTLALLQRLRAPESGRITIDGVDIATVKVDSLRRSIAVVFQDAGLFNRSIAENIRIGRPDATDVDVVQAARIAEAHDFITRKPGGYEFVVGEHGQFLSGGERQRIAIARAVLKDAPILILDEATSALDAETEARIRRALDKLRQGRTTFIIAHRLSTVANADQILVLDQGQIVECGTFRQLVAAGGLFARLVAEGGFTEPVEQSIDSREQASC